MEYVTRDRLYIVDANGKRKRIEPGKKISDGDLSERNIADMVATGRLTKVEEKKAAAKK